MMFNLCENLKKEFTKRVKNNSDYMLVYNSDYILFTKEELQVLLDNDGKQLEFRSDFTLEERKNYDLITSMYNELILLKDIETVKEELKQLRISRKDDYNFNKFIETGEKIVKPKKTQFNSIDKNTRYVIGYYILLDEKIKSVKNVCNSKIREFVKNNKSSVKEEKTDNFDYFTCSRLNHMRYTYILKRDLELTKITILMLQLQQKFNILEDLYNNYCKTTTDYTGNIEFFKQSIYYNFKQCYNITLSNNDIEKFVFLMNHKISSVANTGNLLKSLEKMPFINHVLHCVGQMLIDVKLINVEVYKSNTEFMNSINDNDIHKIAEKAQELFS